MILPPTPLASWIIKYFVDPSELNRRQVELVLTDLDLALTFADMAANSPRLETQNRNRENARKAFFAIRDELLPRCSLDDSQQLEIDVKLRELRSRLEKLGERL